MKKQHIIAETVIQTYTMEMIDLMFRKRGKTGKSIHPLIIRLNPVIYIQISDTPEDFFPQASCGERNNTSENKIGFYLHESADVSNILNSLLSSICMGIKSKNSSLVNLRKNQRIQQTLCSWKTSSWIPTGFHVTFWKLFVLKAYLSCWKEVRTHGSCQKDESKCDV
jgi:hypothetical protein